MEQYIGKILDNRYEILEVLGTGGMAVVYKAKCHRLNRLVAIKVLKTELAGDADFRRRFHAESKAVAMLSHPNIVGVHDVSRGGDLDYIVMELIDGITLKQYMERRGQLNWREALHFITQIMQGLRHAHSRGIIHRDIKPQNIMVLRDGSVKVADFGIACLSNSNQTLMQEALGSVHYISPEQARGDRIDARSDIYSAGVVLYEMLTGRLPFEGDSPVAIAIQHLSSIPLSPREVKEDVPPALELICMKAMASDRDKRYRSAEEMLRDLEDFRKNPEVELAFTVEELMPQQKEEAPEPTVNIRTASGSGGQRRSSAVNQQEGGKLPGEQLRKWLLIGLLSVAVVLGIIGLWRFILGSLQPAEPTEFVVPSVVGMTVEEARAMEGVAGIFEIVEEGQRPSDEYAPGQILSQTPEKDHKKKSDLVIHVYVSSGIESEAMPDLTKEDFRNAKIILRSLDLALTITQEEAFSDEITSGFVISTVPTAGETLKDGDTVTLTVSKGREIKTVKVINFTGIQYEAVMTQLNSLNLVGTTVYVDNSAPAGEVVHQSIPPETIVDEGTTITFEISLGPENPVELRTYVFPENPDQPLIHVFIEQNGNILFDDTVERAMGTIRQTYSDSGPVNVYFDGELVQSEVIAIP